MPELRAQVLPVEDLGTELRQSMFALYSSYYEATYDELFQGDLAAKDYAILLTDCAGELRGFSTLARMSATVDGQHYRALFSGDTIIDPAYWGEQALAFCWIRLAGQLLREAAASPLYWFLIVKGHRTYRYLSVFTKSYYPSWERPTPPCVKRLMDQLAGDAFGDCYDPRTGVIRFARSRGHLRGQWAQIPAQDLRRPEVHYFLRHNPGYARGEELVCLTELHPDNLRPLAQRLFTKGQASCSRGAVSSMR